MQKILGYMRKAIQEFDLIQDGDKIAVGVSGGKDSVVLLTGLARLRRFIGIDYQLVAVTLDPRFGGQDTDYSPVTRMPHGNRDTAQLRSVALLNRRIKCVHIDMDYFAHRHVTLCGHTYRCHLPANTKLAATGMWSEYTSLKE